MTKSYTIEVFKDKIIVTNPIPVMDMLPLSKFAEKILGKNCIMGPSEPGKAGFSILKSKGEIYGKK